MDGEYECWYTFSDKTNAVNIDKISSVNRAPELFNKIDIDEYEFIESKEDVKITLQKYNISDSEASDIFIMVDDAKKSGIGGKKIKKMRHQNKKITKRKNKKRNTKKRNTKKIRRQ